VSKPEVQTLITFVSCRGQVVDSFGFCHSVPFLVSRLVPPNIVDLGKGIYKDIEHRNGYQGPVSPFVLGSVVLAVYIGRDDSRGLDKHIVERCRHGTRTHGVGVSRVPCHLYRVS